MDSLGACTIIRQGGKMYVLIIYYLAVAVAVAVAVA